jgi:hypothetical protein
MQLVRSCDNDLVTTTVMPMFMQYMVASSWQKMRRRISVWSAQGFIYHLGRVDERPLRAVVQSTVTDLQNDTLLSKKLISMEGGHSIPSALLTACRKMQSMPRPDRKEQSKEMSGLYSRDTCFEFHQLLVSTLLDYGKALDKLDDAHGEHLKQPNEQKLVQEMVNCAVQISQHGRLLWAIAYSQILEDHLDVLRRHGWLLLPQNEKGQVELFSGFTAFKRKVNRIANPPGVVKDEAGQDGGDAGEGEGDRADDGGDTVNNDEKEADDCEEDDIKSIINNVLLSDNKNIANIYLGWIRLQVDRWQAPRKITTFIMRAKTSPVDLTLLAVRHPKPILICDAMEPWENTINDLCATKRNQLKAGEVIRVLKDIIGTMPTGDKTRVHSIFKTFDSQRAANCDHNSTVHCEAVLAALSKFPDRAAGGNTLSEQLEV